MSVKAKLADKLDENGTCLLSLNLAVGQSVDLRLDDVYKHLETHVNTYAS